MEKLEKLNNKKSKNKKYRIIGKQSLTNRTSPLKEYDKNEKSDINTLNNHDKPHTHVMNILTTHNPAKLKETPKKATLT